MPTPTVSASVLDLAALRRALGDAAARFAVSAVSECDSSNSRLLDLAQGGAASGSVLVADRQTAGRGRRGRNWVAEPGSSLTFSVLWRFAADSQAPAALSLVAGLALARAMDGLGAADIALKWPNDLLYRGRKLAGILVELQPGQVRSAVIGIGLNLRLPAQLPAELRPHTASLNQALSVAPPREAVLAAILRELAGAFDAYAAAGLAGMRDEWQARHAYAGRAIRLLGEGGSAREGICAGVDVDGALLVQFGDAVERVISADISLRAA